MSKSTRQPATEQKQDLPDFEEALKRLETVVESMESGDLPLEKLLENYAEGSRLIGLCQTRLAQAEQRILEIERQSDGSIREKESQLNAPGSEAGSPDDDQED